MKIHRIDTAYYRFPPHRRIVDAIQEVECLEVIAATIHTDTGAEGFGFTYTIGRGGRATKVLLDTEVVPLILGEDPRDTQRLWEKMWWGLHWIGRHGLTLLASSAIDIALWDLKARQAGQPLFRFLGAARSQHPRVQHRLRLAEPRHRGDGAGGRRLRRPGNPRSQDQGGQGEPLRRRGARPGGEEGGGGGRQAHGGRQPALDPGRSHGPLPSPGRPGPLLDGGALGCRRRAGPRAIEPTHLHPHCAGREPLQPARLQGIPGAGSRQPSCNPTSAVWASPSG